MQFSWQRPLGVAAAARALVLPSGLG